MKLTAFAKNGLVVLFAAGLLHGQGSEQFRALEAEGKPGEARQALESRWKQNPGDLTATEEYARHLDSYGHPETAKVYQSLLEQARQAGDKEREKSAARRLVLLHLLAGEPDAAIRSLDAYRQANGADFANATLPAAPAAAEAPAYLVIPGPLFSFARMAALTPAIAPTEVVAALARNIVTNGYHASINSESLVQTEYLKLVIRYLSQANELLQIAGDDGKIDIAQCESEVVADLLRVLGYRMRGGCGSDLVLETVNATRAFLTIDSGFPLAELEMALRTDRLFEHEFTQVRIPVLFPEEKLRAASEEKGTLLDIFLKDPQLCRLYLGLAKLDPPTATALLEKVDVKRLRNYAGVIDFYGGMFELQNGAAVVPGGARTERVWQKLAGAPPSQGVEFFDKLLGRDDGWLASYFDAVARTSGPLHDYLTQPERLERFYEAIKGKVTSPGPARPVFRANADMMLLSTRLRVEDGQPVLPGGLELWKEVFSTFPKKRIDSVLQKSASKWSSPDQVVEALFALCRKSVSNGPLRIFMAISDVERGRGVDFDRNTVARLVRDWDAYGDQYALFAHRPALTDEAIVEWLDAAAAVNKIKREDQHSDAAGVFQALTGLWQIFSREGVIPPDKSEPVFRGILARFQQQLNDVEIFEAGKASVNDLLAAAGAAEGNPQVHMMALLSGSTAQPEGETREQILRDMNRIFEAQKLVPLDTLFGIEENVQSLASGGTPDSALAGRLAFRITEIPSPRESLTRVEKNALSSGFWSERHINEERKFNVRAELEKTQKDPKRIGDTVSKLTPFLRDTLVGYLYLYYAPPGAQILLTNPTFVRSHDFIGPVANRQTFGRTSLYGSGWPNNHGGRLVGSLLSLPYALADAEQNFLVPDQEQALIWQDLVPQMILSAKVPRWWNVSPAQMHWVGLHMRRGANLLAEGALGEERRKAVLGALHDYAAPVRVHRVEQLLQRGDVPTALDYVTPAELYKISLALDSEGPLAAEVRSLRERAGDQVSEEAISRAFGTPKPTLTTSYRPALLHLRTFPTLMGHSSRIMAESWESANLFWAALADELNARPAELNVLIPEWTRRTVEGIFATHLEDWPALLRSLKGVGDTVRASHWKNQEQAVAQNLNAQ